MFVLFCFWCKLCLSFVGGQAAFNMFAFVFFFPLYSATEDVELWFAEVENLLAVEDLGKVNLNIQSIQITILLTIFSS